MIFFLLQQPSIVRLGVLLLLFDVYLTWRRIEEQTIPDALPGQSNLGVMADQPIVFQYLFFCTDPYLYIQQREKKKKLRANVY